MNKAAVYLYFIHGLLFNSAVSSSDYIALNDELERMWKEAVVG
jgi:hypothetical protein